MNARYDVAVIGAGPAGLSGALLLARSRRSVVVCDDGQPRNYAAHAVHGFLGSDGINPALLRRRGMEECKTYGVEFIESSVVIASREEADHSLMFHLGLKNGMSLKARKVLLATGVKDELPQLPGFQQFYGTTIHHCPYCDGWEHADKTLVAYGKGPSAAKLAVKLLAWSKSVICCSDGAAINDSDCCRLKKYGIRYRPETIKELVGTDGQLQSIMFSEGVPLACDALFFSAGHGQRSSIPEMLGCECNDRGLALKHGKQGSGNRGVFLAGDADGDVQFAIVAAAEGAVAATAINSELQDEDYP
jgi:thioredoxin reductase